jgi:hypothetical protein
MVAQVLTWRKSWLETSAPTRFSRTRSASSRHGSAPAIQTSRQGYAARIWRPVLGQQSLDFPRNQFVLVYSLACGRSVPAIAVRVESDIC